MSATLLGSKLHSPALPSGILPRRRLVEAAATCDMPVVSIVAPPGFGKTVLLAQWEEFDDRPFAWVSLDRGDNDPLVLWNYLVAAIRRVEPGFGAAVEPALGSAGGLMLEAIIPRILNELESMEREIVLVLDDYHWVTNPASHESIAFLVEHCPANAQLVVSSRLDPPLAFARLRANGGLFELRAAELAFSEDETEELFAGAFGVDLGPDTIATLQRRTEGWPAGLYLAFLSVRDVSDPTAALDAFGGSSRHVVDYLTEVVLDAETDEHRSFLLETSILERMCVPLCDTVTATADSTRVLAEIERANLFLVPLDDHGQWFRYHHLFAELLRDALRRRDGNTEPVLHRRACAWLETAGEIDAAIQHAIKGADLETAATLVATHWAPHVSSGRLATVSSWLEAFPRDVVRADARLCIVEAWLHSLTGDAKAAGPALDAAREAGYEGELPDGSGTVEESVTLARSTWPWSEDGVMLTAARLAYITESRRRSQWQALASVNLGWALVLTGATDEAIAPLEHAARLGQRHEQWIVAADAHCLRAKAALVAGELGEAERWIGEALELARSHGIADLPHVGYYHATVGALHAHRGELEAADQAIGLGLEQMQGADSLLIADALLERALVRRALGARTEARAALAEARAIIENCPDPGILTQHLDDATRRLTTTHARASSGSVLTQRELEVLRLLAGGLTKRQVGDSLFLSYSTIHSHTKSIYRKLDAASREQVLEHARELGLLFSNQPNGHPCTTSAGVRGDRLRSPTRAECPA